MASALIWPVFAAAVLFQAADYDFKTTDQAFGKTFVSGFSMERLAATPIWDEADDNPPVSARAALMAAKAMRDSVAKAPEGFKWSRGSLTLMRPDEHCYWIVYFMANKEGDNGRHRFTAIVLMDGTTVKPIVKSAQQAE